ncbi:MAG: DUF2569 family protein [Opitutaceae bacterium]|nr:DUF2569 family protein [Opitutaceae bacterium]
MRAADPAEVRRVAAGPVPDWVRSCEWNFPAAAKGAAKPDDKRYLLYELQEHPARTEKFVRIVVLMENEAGVQDSGNLSFGFNAGFQELVVHRVQVHRDGQVLDRLDATKIKVIQPERDLDDHVLTGGQSALLFVEDLRVGDALEYSYTTRGANPALGGHFAARYKVQSNIAVDRQRVRVVWTSPEPLRVKPDAAGITPTVQPFAEGTEHVWDFAALKPIPWEDYLPPAFEPHPFVELSDFHDWSRVVDWALPLYRLDDATVPPELADLIARWKTEENSPAGQALRALAFVQDELRYTGLELGPDSYRPAPPLETFQKRFGDCKGKVMLLCLLLRELGIEAWPALVDTYLRDGVAQRLPSPFAFNHVIARIVIGGRSYWVDPTRSHQGGPLAERQISPFGKALVIQAGGRELEDVPVLKTTGLQQRTVSTFQIRGYDVPAEFSVKTIFRGAGADDMRATLARSKPKDIAKDYLNFYARYYPGVAEAAPMTFADDRRANVITMTEAYEVRELWKPKEDKRWLKAEFWPESLIGMLREPSTRLRSMPLALPNPHRREHEVIVKLHDKGWALPEERMNAEHEAFTFSYRRTATESSVRFLYRCETLAREIPAAAVPGYLAKRKEVEDRLGDMLSRGPEAGASGMGRINWLMVVIALFGFVACVGAAIGYAWWSARPRPALAGIMPPPLPGLGGPVGLGGWLVLVGIGLCLGQVRILFDIVSGAGNYLLLDSWEAVASPKADGYHPLFGPLLMFEMLGNIALLVLNALAVTLFFTKRKTFPRVYIALLAYQLCFLLADHVLGAQIPAVAKQTDVSALRDLVRAFAGLAIWGSYALVSKRVKATFVH